MDCPISDLTDLCMRLAAVRERPMVILPYRFPKPDVFALFIDTEDRDLFLIEPDTDPDLRDHNLGHEIGHCLEAYFRLRQVSA